jgi:hypothetical protein
MTCAHFLDNRPEEAVLSFEAAIILAQELIEVMEEHPVEHSALRMSGAVHSCHIRSSKSRNAPTSWTELPPPEKTGRAAQVELFQDI